MLMLVYTVLVVLLLFGATIFVHELGHFLTARWLGLVVETFSIGFGPALWKWRKNGILYKVGMVPFGGYVALPQIDHGRTEETNDPARPALPPAPPWKKIIVSVSGAAGNLVLAFLISLFIFWVGKPAAPSETSSVIGFVDPDSPAHEAGLRPGHRILTVNGEPVNDWTTFRILSALHEEVRLAAESPDGLVEARLITKSGLVGIREVPGLGPLDEAHVLAAVPGSSASAAGVQPGDLIVAYDGEPVFSIEHLVFLVNRHPGRPAELLVRRAGREVRLTVTPAYDETRKRALIGVEFNPYVVNPERRVHPRPLAQMREHASRILRVLQALVTPREAPHAARALGGPPAILFSLWMTIQSSLVMALWFTGFLNVNLAILNLLPLPVLDGGHVVFSLIEMIRGKPMHRRVVDVLHTIFIVLLVFVMLFLSWRDVGMLRSLRRGADAEEDLPAVEAPAP